MHRKDSRFTGKNDLEYGAVGEEKTIGRPKRKLMALTVLKVDPWRFHRR